MNEDPRGNDRQRVFMDQDVDLGMSENQEVGSYTGSMPGRELNHDHIDLALDDRSNSNSSMAFRNAMGSLIMSGKTGQSVSRVTNSKMGADTPQELSLDNIGQSVNDRSQNYGRMASVSDNDRNQTIDLPEGVGVIHEENESEFDKSLNQSHNNSAHLSGQALSIHGS